VVNALWLRAATRVGDAFVLRLQNGAVHVSQILQQEKTLDDAVKLRLAEAIAAQLMPPQKTMREPKELSTTEMATQSSAPRL
jgi:hypothetical protein